MNFIKAILLVVALALVAAGVFIASGIYSIGADKPHWEITARVIDLLRNRSIEKHAQGITVPNLDEPGRLAEGAEHYAAMCTGCHLAPGMQDSELRAGLYPTPPNLAEHRALDAAKAFWVIKHGVKLTAMPAWGKTHSDEAIWGLVAFVKKLPDLTLEQYHQMVDASGEHEHSHGPHDHEEDDREHGGATHDDQDHDASHEPRQR